MTWNRHGWLLCTDGARAAVAIRYEAFLARKRACPAALRAAVSTRSFILR